MNTAAASSTARTGTVIVLLFVTALFLMSTRNNFYTPTAAVKLEVNWNWRRMRYRHTPKIVIKHDFDSDWTVTPEQKTPRANERQERR